MKNPLLRAQGRFFANARIRLIILASVLAAAWYWASSSPLRSDEMVLWEKVRYAQAWLWNTRGREGVLPALYADPEKTGFIGLEWSPITTTLGPLEAKRTAADPLWSVYALRQLRRLGIGEGDPVAVLSSSSFPGLVYSVLAAAEFQGASILWIHSLGSSTWGANDTSFPWPAIAAALRRGGFMAKKADWYTFGGRAEAALDLPEEGRGVLERAAALEGVPLLEGRSLQEMTDAKWEIISGFAPRILVNIGGGAAAFGGAQDGFPGGGLFTPGGPPPPGGGLLRLAFESGIPVLHFLDMKGMGSRAGIPYDGRPSPRFRASGGPAVPAAGLAFFFFFLLFFKRWDRWEL